MGTAGEFTKRPGQGGIVTSESIGIPRRRFLQLFGLGGGALVAGALLEACGQSTPTAPSAAPSPAGTGTTAPAQAQAAPSTAAQDEWNAVLSAAKQEGKVSVVTAPGDIYRQVFDEFQNTYGIPVDLLVGGGSADLVPKVSTERQAGQFNWDATVHSPINSFSGFKQINALQPLRPAFILPEVLDDKNWIGGFDAGWADNDKSLVYSFVGTLSPTTFINRSVIPEATLSSLDQIWDPTWAGQIAMDDARLPSVGALVAATFLIVKGEDKLRTFYSQQMPVLTQDRRQLAEWIIRGQYPIALGVQLPNLQDFVNEGLNIDQVQVLSGDDPALLAYSSGTGAVSMFDKAPHPNAAKVLINWVTSQQGQSVWSVKTAYNSRRTDVTPVNPKYVVDPTKQYPNTQIESGYPNYGRAIQISKEEIQ